MTIDFIADGPDGAPATVLLAHGAGAPMDSPTMNAIALALAGVNLRVARFEFGYMAAPPGRRAQAALRFLRRRPSGDDRPHHRRMDRPRHGLMRTDQSQPVRSSKV